MKYLCGALLGLAFLALCTAAPVYAESTGQEVAYGAGSAFGTLLYAPFKTVFCVVGAVTSALAFPFGGSSTTEKVATAACGGTWAITPDVLKGREQIRFIGGGRGDVRR